MIRGRLLAPHQSAPDWWATLRRSGGLTPDDTFEYGDWYVHVTAPDENQPYWHAAIMHGLTLHADARSLLRTLGRLHPAAPGSFLALLDVKLQAAPATTPAWVNRAIRDMTTQTTAQDGPGFWHHQTAADTYGALLQTTPELDEAAVRQALRQLGPGGTRVADALCALPGTELEVDGPLPALLLTLTDASDDGADLASDVHEEYRDWLGLASDHLGTLSTITRRDLTLALRAAGRQLAATHVLAATIRAFGSGP